MVGWIKAMRERAIDAGTAHIDVCSFSPLKTKRDVECYFMEAIRLSNEKSDGG